MVQVTVCRCIELERPEADIVERLVVDTEGLVRVFDQLVHRKGRVVRLDDLIDGRRRAASRFGQRLRLCSNKMMLTHSVGNLRRRNDGEGSHHPVWELLADLRDEERSHTGTGTTSERVCNLETLYHSASVSPPAAGMGGRRKRTWSWSHPSASLRTTSSTLSTSSAPSETDHNVVSF